MSNSILTDLPELTTPATDDSLYIVDKSDTTDDPNGSSKKSLISTLVTYLQGLVGWDATKLQSRTVASTAPTTQQVLTWNAGSSQWEPAAPAITSPLTIELNLGENYGIALDSALSADGKYSGLVTAGATAGLTFGTLCYYDVINERWAVADANSATTYDKKLGICVLTVSGGNPTKILLLGNVRADAIFPTLTIGAPVYMSEVAGEIVVTQPTTANVCIRKIGFANTDHELYFNPSNDYIVHI